MFRPADDAPRCSRRVVIGLVLLALVVRLGWGLTRPTDAASIERLPDQREYLDLGRSLLEGRGLAMVDPRFNDVVRAFRMPGYPAFVAACGGNVVAIRATQAVLGASIVLATVWLARRWLSPRIGYLAGTLVALDPIHVYFGGLVLSETLFAALLAWGMACLAHGASPGVRGSRGRHAVWAIGIALSIGAIYVRPSALAFPVVLTFAAMLIEARSADAVIVRRVPVVSLVALATLAALLPWALRNRLAVGQLLFTTTNDGFTLYDGLNADADGSSDQSWVGALPLLASLSEAQRSDYLRGEALRFARAEPMRVVRLVPTKLRRTWSPWPLSAEFGSRRLYVLGAATHAVPLFALAICGALRRPWRRSMRLFLLVPAILVTMVHGLSVGSLRYRMPVDASLAVLAAGAFQRRAREDRAAAR